MDGWIECAWRGVAWCGRALGSCAALPLLARGAGWMGESSRVEGVD